MSIRIVLVDDHLLVRQGIRALLQNQADMQIVGEAGDGNAALAIVSTLKPDLVIMDIEMPGMDGIDTSRRIREISPETRILVLSMHSEKRYVSEILSIGVLGYLLKDEDIEDLVKAIHTVLAGKMFISSRLMETIVRDYSNRVVKPKEPEIGDLTPREQEILKLIVEGYTTREISSILKLKFKTVDTHRQQIMRKLDLHNVVDLTKFAIRQGIIDL